MQIIFAGEDFPHEYSSAVFLVGPTPRSKEVSSWRPEALRYFEEIGYNGVVFVPEDREGGVRRLTESEQEDWEDRGLNLADCILAWVPRDLQTMPAFTTNVEFGKWMESGKVVFGAPQGALKTNYLLHWAQKLNIPTATTLKETISAAINLIGAGDLRSGGERYVPLYVWRTRHFQSWYQTLRAAGNRLDWAKVEWTFRVGPRKNIVLFFALRVDIFVASENRHKNNEVMLTRPDIASVLLYQKRDKLEDTPIVLIREFRTPVHNETGFVWELPGGSSFNANADPFADMAEECDEEVGLKVDPYRVRRHETREINPTVSAHSAHFFSVELTDEELARLRDEEALGVIHGAEGSSELTHVHVLTLGEIMKSNYVSWSMMGMILTVLVKDR